MNHSPFWPLVWKEYRAGRAFWLAMAGMGLVAQASVAWMAHRPTDRNWWLYAIALMISAGFAVGIGGTLFAVEHEDHTIALLRRLPLRARELGAAKILSALAGLVALVALLWFAARAMAGGQSLSATQASRLWTLWGLACLEGLAWGILYSLVIRHPLRATVAAALTAAFVVSWSVRHDFSALSFAQSIPLRTSVLVLIVLADAALLPCWLEGHLPRWQRPWQRVRRWLAGYLPRLQSVWQRVRQRAGRANPSWRRPLVHLAWQTMREGRTSFLLLILAAPAVFVLPRLFRVVIGTEIPAPGLSNFLLILMPLGLLAAVDGALVFRADQRHGPRFLAEQGVSPRTIWFSRQLVWGCWLWGLVVIVALSFLAVFSLAMLSLIVRYWSQATGPVFGSRFFFGVEQPLFGALTTLQMLWPAYAVGQFASLLVRRGLLAVTLGLVLGALATCWVWLMQMLGVSWWWSVLPLPVGMLLATWLRLPGWMVERSGLRAWLAPAAAALVPVAALLVAVPAFRMLQIPPASPDFAWPASSPAAIAGARDTLELYTKAWDLYLANREETPEKPAGAADSSNPSSPDEGWHKPVVDLAIEASRRDFSLLVPPIPERRAAAPRIEKLASVVVSFAQKEQKAGKLDSALDAYLATFAMETQLHECFGEYPPNYRRALQSLRAWAAAPGQTAERIRTAIKRLNLCHAALPRPDARLLPEYEETALTINDLAAAVAAEIVPVGELTQGDWITSRLPWERARARRLLDRLATFQLTGASEVLDAMATGRPIRWDNRLARYADPDSRDRVALAMAFFRLGPTPLVDHGALARQSLRTLLLHQETSYRATVIVLALQAWRAEHGELPERLDELVGAEIDKLPLDPLFALPFRYYPHGTTAQQEASTNAGSDPAAVPQGAGVWFGFGPESRPLITDEPFLWSALSRPNAQHSIGLLPPTSGGDLADFPYGLVVGGEVAASSAADVLGAGTVYPILLSAEEHL